MFYNTSQCPERAVRSYSGKGCSEKFSKIQRIIPVSDFNKKFRRRCFSVTLALFERTTSLQNIFGRLLLNVISLNI